MGWSVGSGPTAPAKLDGIGVGVACKPGGVGVACGAGVGDAAGEGAAAGFEDGCGTVGTETLVLPPPPHASSKAAHVKRTSNHVCRFG